MTRITQIPGVDWTVVVLEGFTAFAIAVLAIGLCAVAVRDRTSLPAAPLFFAVLFLASWAGGVWGLRLLSERWALVYWTPYLAGGLLTGALALTASLRPGWRPSPGKATRETGRAPRLTLAEASLWALVLAFAASIVANYATRAAD